MGPILLRPNYISPVWSGPRINEARGLEADVWYGESFDISVHEGLVNMVEGGPFDGMPLDRLIDEHREEIMGECAGDPGIVQVLTMDAAQNLSVQVHPDEAYAQAHEHDHEKTESWYILAADPGATIILGTTTDDVGALRAAAADDTIGERYGRRVPVEEGDFVLVPAGTLHALGAGVFALEVGSFGFKTYRICDWGRGRELHVKQGFDVLRTESRPEPRRLGALDPKAPAGVRRGITTSIFVSDVADVRGSWMQDTCSRYHIISCVAGTAKVETEDGTAALAPTRSLIVPASAGSYTVEGCCRVLRSYAAHSCEIEDENK